MNRQIVETTLLTLGMPSKLKGFTYISDAVILLDNPEWKNPKWTYLYHYIGCKHGTNSSLVEASIRHALKSTRDKNYDFDKIEYYLGFGNCENSNSIMLLYSRLKQDEQQKLLSINSDTIRKLLIELLSK